jgi:DeoR family transcriptional regulator, ulaG and ulaABCDEF operon transcriptional repressor
VHERERWQVIKAMLQEDALVRIADACRATGASEASVRRDFLRLAKNGVATRVHGGLEALPGARFGQSDAPASATSSFDINQTLNIAAKRALARAAVALCSDGEAIIINGGTTTFEMGAFLRERRLKVLTNSYPLAETLIRDSKCRVALPGGEVYRDQKLIVSPFEEDAIQHYSATRMFMSAISIGALGVTEGDPLVARAETKLLKRADKLIVLADSSKFVSRGSLVVCPLSRIPVRDPAPQRVALRSALPCEI